MTPLKLLILIVVGFGVAGCRDSNPAAIPPSGKRVGIRPQIRGLSAQVGARTRGAGFGPTTFDVSPTNMNWHQFRGDHGRNVAQRDDLLKRWSEEEGIDWQTELPGRGASSPIVLYKHVYVTSASGYGESAENPGDRDELRHHVICVEHGTGAVLWQRDIQGSPLTQELNPEVLRHGFASSTPISDGRVVYAFFGPSGVFAFEREEGELIWHADVGFQNHEYGSAASLTMYRNLLIVNASIENQTVYAIDRKTGKGVWKIDGINRSWSTPVIDSVPDGSDEMIILEEGYVRGFDPKTGRELWHCEGIHDYVVATPFVQDGVCFCNGGVEKQMMAIKLGGRGDVTETHKLWEVQAGATINSPIYKTGYLFLMSDEGLFQCFNARNGELVSSSQMPTKSLAYASPLLSSNTFYIPLEDNGVVVCEANSQMTQISHNTFAGDSNSLKSSLAVSEAALFLRNESRLYRLSHREGPGAFVSLTNFTNQSELVVPPPRYDFDSVTGRLRRYNQFLSEDKTDVEKKILISFEATLTEKQTAEARKLIDKRLEKFAEFRQQQREALWKCLQTVPREEQQLKDEFASLDRQVLSEVEKIRKSIEGLLTDEQKQQLENGGVAVAQPAVVQPDPSN